MFGRNGEDEGSEADEANGVGDTDTPNETWNELVSEVEEAAAQRIEKEREPFRFDVFRTDEGDVTQWALMADKHVEGRESRVPVVVGNEEDQSGAVWFEYQSRFQGERDGPTVFEFVQKESVVPSNAFYKWLSEAVEAVGEFNTQLEKIDGDAFQSLDPDLPPLYDDLNEYEAHALKFFGGILVDHRDYTEDQAGLIHEALRRYPVDDEVWDAFTGEKFEYNEDEDADLPGENEEGTLEA